MAKTEILGIIPARGGSKRLPGKNIALLNGKPLLVYTCEAAKQSKHLTRIVLSTDSEDIARAGRECGIDVPFMRPADLARDDTTSAAVALHVLAELEKRERYVPAIVVLLQPTSPLRTSDDIDAAVDLLLQTKADSVISVTESGERNGAVYAIRTDALLRTGDFVGGKNETFIMDAGRSVDIDTAFDLAHAENLLRKRS